MKADACFTSNTGLWETPQYLFNALDARFHFGLDACAIPENAKCENFFTPKDDALKQSWGGYGATGVAVISDMEESTERMGV